MLRSLVFFIREGHVQRTSEDKQLLVRDSELVDVFQLAIKKVARNYIILTIADVLQLQREMIYKLRVYFIPS